ncbi:MAG: transglycosylase SLT domain-containing protein [bacterium]|nr:transglycosylase SLT domain-containing protein [bacterium]
MKHPSQNLITILFLSLLFLGTGCAFFPHPPPTRPLPDPENLYAYGLNLYRDHRYPETIEILQALQEAFPQSPKSEAADLIIGLALLQSGRPAKAQAFLRLAIQSRPDLADLLMLSLSEAQMESGETEAAERNLRDFTAIFPSSPYLEQALFLQAEVEEKMKNYDQAQKFALQLLENFRQSPSQDRYLFLHARVARANGDLPAAVHSLREIWIQQPLSPLLPEAEDLLSRLPSVSWPPSPEERSRQALLLYLSGELDPAEKIFTQLVSDLEPGGDPRLLASSLFRLGMIKFKKRQYPDARDRLQKLLQMDNLPPELTEETLLYLGRARARNREPEEAEKTYRALLEKYPGGKVSDEALYLLGRLQEDQGAGNEALKTYREILERFPQSPFAAEINWRIGWNSYLQNNFAEAAGYFSRIPETGVDLISDLKPRFWKARALRQSGHPDQGNLILNELSDQFPLTYYGFLSALILRAEGSITLPQIRKYPLEKIPGPDVSGWPPDSPGPGQLPPDAAIHLQRASELIDLGLYPEASQELHFLAGQLSSLSPAAFLPVGLDLVRIGNLPWLLSLCESYFLGELKGKPGSQNRVIWELAYPRGFRQLSDFYARQYGLDPNLILAVIREESRFAPQVLSPAGAVGLMQIMPKTGVDIARGLGQPGFSPASLSDPETSIEFGYYYLQKLSEQFQGNLAYTIGAYNAGPNKIREWLAAKPRLDLFEFIEDIPYPETNGYVKKVLQNYLRYSYLYPEQSS